jgi:hypothetical protein
VILWIHCNSFKNGDQKVARMAVEYGVVCGSMKYKNSDEARVRHVRTQA